MATYLNSDAVEAFPAALRTFSGTTGKYTTEDNLATIFRATAGKDSFTINRDPLEFVIHGHYFKIINTNGLSSKNLTAYIVENNSTKTLVNAESNHSLELDVKSGEIYKFQGLCFGEAPADTAGYSVHSLQITGAGGELINEIPRLSAITVGAGLSTNVSGGVITSTGAISLATTGVVSGTYQGITFDAFGRATAAEDKGYQFGTVTKITAGSGLTTTADGTGGNITTTGTLYLTSVYGSSAHLGTTANADDFTTVPANYKPVDFYIGTDGRITSGKTFTYPFKDIVNPIISSYLSENGVGTATTANALKVNYNSITSYRPVLLAPWDINQTSLAANIFTYNTVSVNTQSGYIKATKFIGADTNVKAFVGDLSGNADTATTATTANVATKLKLTLSTTATYRPVLITTATATTDSTSVYIASNIKVNPSDGYLSAPKFIGDLSGNASTATVATRLATMSNNITSNYKPILVIPSTSLTSNNNVYASNIASINLGEGAIRATRFEGLLWTPSGDTHISTVGAFSTTARKAQAVYLNNGTITAGQTIYWSTAAAASTSGAVGDI